MHAAVHALASLAVAASAHAQPAVWTGWTHYAGDAARSSAIADAGPDGLGTPRWVATHDDAGNPIEFNGSAGVAVGGGVVLAVGWSGGKDRIYAFDVRNGTALWSSPIPEPPLDSWSMPAIDARTGHAYMGAGRDLIALDLRDGSELWRTKLQRPVVNASPALATDRPRAGRLFITDYDGTLATGGGRLYAINIEPFLHQVNPHEPGDIVWSVSLGDATSGNSPAYNDGRVFVATAGSFFGGVPGRILAFDAHASEAPAPAWVFTNTVNLGFYGGVAVRDGAVYAASYAFSGGQLAANLVKVDAGTGSLHWSAPAGRTSSTPVPLGDGRVALSVGIQGFGATPALQLFRDDGTSAALLWDSALDGGHGLGGWTHQPLVIERPDGGRTLVAGALPPSGVIFDPYEDLSLIDLDHSPVSPGFVIDAAPGAGSTPAAAGESVYSVGPWGLVAFGPTPEVLTLDVNGDGVVDIEDLYAWEQGEGRRDVNNDGVVDERDRDALIEFLRRDELDGMAGAAGR